MDGFDFQADYRLPLMAGTLSASIVGNSVLNQSQENLGTVIDYAGALSSDNNVSGMPRARANGSLTYRQDDWSLTGQVRFIGAGKLVYSWTSKDVDRNKVPAIAYVDVRGSYRLMESLEMLGTVDNLLDQAPPVIPGTFARGQGVYYAVATRGDIYDQLGRTCRIGVRLDF